MQESPHGLVFPASLPGLWDCRESPPSGEVAAQSTGGGPVPGGALDCSLFRQSECSGGSRAPLVLLLGAVPRRGLPDCALPQALPSSSLGPLGATSPSAPVWQQQTILMLKEQNRLLTQVRCGKMGLGLVALQTLTAPLPALPPRR